MDVIACAETTLHVAIYKSEWDCLLEAMLTRLEQDSDLVIEIVADDRECPLAAGSRGCSLSILEDHPRVTIVDDQRSLLMHHKFIVADGARVYVSSGNLSRVSFCTDFNNSLVVDQAEIVAAYEAVFQRLFTEGDFSPVPAEEPVSGGVYSVYFSPETPSSDPSGWFNDLVAAIDGATTSVDAMIFALTRTEVSDALIAAHGRGVAVRLLTSPRFAGEGAVTSAAAAGVPVRTDNVHSKILVVDGQLVVTGSANWSAAAWGNQENALFIDDADVAADFTVEIDRAWALADE
jgi:phosphatidylserine/phosphatidylglycerophosphate/cardiolipin synthase-like enzyme